MEGTEERSYWVKGKVQSGAGLHTLSSVQVDVELDAQGVSYFPS